MNFLAGAAWGRAVRGFKAALWMAGLGGLLAGCAPAAVIDKLPEEMGLPAGTPPLSPGHPTERESHEKPPLCSGEHLLHSDDNYSHGHGIQAGRASEGPSRSVALTRSVRTTLIPLLARQACIARGRLSTTASSKIRSPGSASRQSASATCRTPRRGSGCSCRDVSAD